MIKGIKFCEGEFSGTVEFENEAERRAFSDGFSAGGGEYGAGSCRILTREDLPELDPEWDAMAIAAIKKYLPAGPLAGDEERKT